MEYESCHSAPFILTLLGLGSESKPCRGRWLTSDGDCPRLYLTHSAQGRAKAAYSSASGYPHCAPPIGLSQLVCSFLCAAALFHPLPIRQITNQGSARLRGALEHLAMTAILDAQLRVLKVSAVLGCFLTYCTSLIRFTELRLL